MESRLLLFVDENFIVPVVCDADGRMHTMEAMNYSGADDVQYLEGLTDFYRSATGISVIDTHFLFVESLDMNFRRKFISVLQKEGLNPVSFTCVPSVVLTDFAVAQGLTSPAVFGDSVIILYSSSDLLKVTGTVYDGNSWQWNAKVSVFDGVGDSPLKKAVVECVVNERDRVSGFLSDARSRNEEIEWQMNNADEWLAVYKNSDQDMVIRDYRYHFDNSSSSTVRFSKKVIEQYYEKRLAPAVSGISEYVKNISGNSLKLAVLVGPAFEEERFCEKAKMAVGSPNVVSITSPRLPKALSVFFSQSGVKDDFSTFDAVMVESMRRYKAVQEWIGSAGMIHGLKRSMSAELATLTDRVRQDSCELQAVFQRVDGFLQKSAFDEAEIARSILVIPTPLTDVSVQTAMKLLAKKEDLEPVMEKLNAVPGARELISGISILSEQIQSQLQLNRQDQKALNKDKKDEIQFYREHYDEYLELKKKYLRASDFKSKKELVEAMSGLTKESLPALRLNQVAVELFGEKQRVKTGLFSRKESLHVGMKVLNDEELPCDAVLNVSRKVVIRATEEMPGCLAFQVEKGRRDFSVDIDFPVDGLDFKEPVYVCLFVGKDVLDKQAVKCNCLTIK